ncbi:MAG TPA: hypothetical protein VJY15_05310 [Candidatus Acidoferrum sp.]|nr:hypothetical protein [Candidatus Acidoferrum sp.]
MRCSYRCAFILAVLFACIQTTGCQSSASNILKVTTTSLPNGIVGTPYVASLTATGGTPGYTWSQTSGGTMPNGVSLGSSGIFNGTPTTTGTFGPYVFEVTDSTGATASSVSLSITVTSDVSPQVALCTALGNEAALTPATPYAFLVKGTDGSGNPVDIAGSFTPNGSGGITNATVDYNGMTNGPEQLQVNLAASSYSFGSSTLGCLSLAFSGPVADAASAKHAGVTPHFAHGAGVRARNSKARAAGANTVSSAQFTFSLSGFDGTLYHTGRIIESDNTGGGTNASGFIHAQVPSAFSLTSLQPNYAFGVDGWSAESAGYFRTAIAGTFTNSSGALSAGYADLNAGGTPSGELTGGGGTLNFAINATSGRGTGTYTIPTASGNLTFDFAFYILNGSDLILLSSDPPATAGSAPLLSGRALASSARHASGVLNGYYLLASQGLDVRGSNIGNRAEIGTLNATSAGTIPTAILYVNDAGTYSNTPYSNGSYAVEVASGRVAITGLTATPPVVYLTAAGTTDDGIAGFLVGSDTAASFGVVVGQSSSAPAYVSSSVPGNYAASTQEDADGRNGASLGAFSFTGAGQYIATQRTTGLVPNLPSLGMIATSSDGSGRLNGGNFTLVTNGAVIFAIPDSGDPLIYVFTAGKLPY